MNTPRKINAPVIPVLFTFLLFLSFSCDEFKSQEFEISEKDNLACTQFADSIQDPASDTLKIIAQPLKTLQLVALTDFNASWVDSNVAANVPDILDSLTGRALVVHVTPDTAYMLKTLADEMNNYMVFAPAAGAVVFYLSESADILLMKTDGTIIKPSNQNMPLPTVSGCTVVINNSTEPKIKTRLEFNSPDEHYLLKLIKNDQTKSGDIKCSVIPM
jgi:hypothetical protein